MEETDSRLLPPAANKWKQHRVTSFFARATNSAAGTSPANGLSVSTAVSRLLVYGHFVYDT